MDGLQLSPELHELFEDILVWIGFGTIVGLAAKGIMPGRDPGGPLVTLLLGVVGSVIGCGVAGCFFESGRITPISPFGMVVAVAGAFFLLFCYRSLKGHEALQSMFPYRDLGDPDRSAMRRRYSSAMYED